MRCVASVIALLLLAATLSAQQPESNESDVKSRDLSNMFYSDTLPAAKPEGTPARAKAGPRQTGVSQRSTKISSSPAMQRRVGLKFSVLLHDTDCNVQQVAATRVFKSGEKIRLQIESNVDGYLSVLQKGSSGNESLLFPDPRINGGENRVQRGIQYSIPPSDWFTFNDQPGEEDLLIIVSRQSLTSLPKPSLPSDSQQGSEPVKMAATLSALEQTVQPRDLAIVEEKAPHVATQPQLTQSLIVLNTSNVQNETVYLHIKLKHR